MELLAQQGLRSQRGTGWSFLCAVGLGTRTWIRLIVLVQAELVCSPQVLHLIAKIPAHGDANDGRIRGILDLSLHFLLDRPSSGDLRHALEDDAEVLVGVHTAVEYVDSPLPDAKDNSAKETEDVGKHDVADFDVHQ